MIEGTLVLVVGLVFALAFLFSMLGLGGALLYIPRFQWFGYDFKSVAIPTGLLLNGLTALSASSYYLRSRMVDVKRAIPMIVTSILGAPLGAVCTRWVPTHVLIMLFAIGMLVAGGVAAWRVGSSGLSEWCSSAWRSSSPGPFRCNQENHKRNRRMKTEHVQAKESLGDRGKVFGELWDQSDQPED